MKKYCLIAVLSFFLFVLGSARNALAACTDPANGCEDNNVCTNNDWDATVVDGVCPCLNTSNTLPCSDSDVCNGDEVCGGGTCNAGTPLVIDDGNPCTDDSCDPGTGVQHANNTSACTDGDACTLGDVCSGGVCVPGAAKDCSDGKTCTDDVCTAGACSNPENCTGGQECNTAGNCETPACTPQDCDDGNLCTNDSNNTTAPGPGLCPCINSNNTSVCTDNDACTLGDACSGGVCVPGAAKDCSDGKTCTDDVCTAGACSNPENCTGGQECNTAGNCETPACTPQDCDDGNLCTDDSNNTTAPGPGLCPCINSNNTSVCTDNDACTLGDACSGGVCVPGAAKDCSDGKTCTDDVCTSGACSNPENCTGGQECNTAGNCETPACSPQDCDDGNLCTDDSNNTTAPGPGLCPCINSNNTSACTDGDACTLGDVCTGGVCVPGAAKDCSDGKTCTDDVCTSGACSNPENCTGGQECNTAGNCETPACTPQDCDDGNLCTDDSNNTTAPGPGLCSCVNTNNTAPCNDGNGCTQTDKCSGGSCVGSNPKACTASDQCHDIGTCKPSTGLCPDPPKPNGSSCNDSVNCTDNDVCSNGSCSGTAIACQFGDCEESTGTCPGDPCFTTTCNDSNPCTNDSCDSSSGSSVCVYTPNSNSCDDGNACTQIDTCENGTCKGTTPKVCVATDQCHDAGTCNISTGACSNPIKANGTICNDVNACTKTDTCQSGTCTGTNPKVCTASDQCHDVGTCNTTSGVCSDPDKANGSPCDDSNLCTQTDTCQAGACNGSNPVVCTASDQCHDVGTCDTSTGECSDPVKTDGSTCDDEDLCTLIDVCTAGSCAGDPTPPPNTKQAGVCVGSTKTCSVGVGWVDDYSTVEFYEDPETSCDGKDNDCIDGTDPGCECITDETQECGSDVGECEFGLQTCVAGQWGDCEGEIVSSEEVCDGKDNDCNGTDDDGFNLDAPCVGIGACGDGVIECAGEQLSQCSTDPGGSADQSSAEVCDGIDNDCNGTIDDGFNIGASCDGIGACGEGVLECADLSSTLCSTHPGGSQDGSSDEICDGIDNDCDEELDEDCSPQVIKTVPIIKSGVSIATDIEILFSTEMDATIDPESILAVVESTKSNAVAGITLWNQDGTMIVFTPDSYFDVDTEYTVTVSESVTDIEGHILDGDNDRFPGGDHVFSMTSEFDGDTLSDDEENNMETNSLSQDSDGDGITDDVEVGPDFRTDGPRDSDEDETIDALDLDSDGDGKLDSVEGVGDSDADGTPNYRDNDDNSGPLGDQDGDLLTNIDEAMLTKTNPNSPDSDQDGIDDLTEVVNISKPFDTDEDLTIDAWDKDSDNDGGSDLEEGHKEENGNSIPDRLENNIVSGLSTLQSIQVISPAGVGLRDVCIMPIVDFPEEERPAVDFMFDLVYLRIINLNFGEEVQLKLIHNQVIPEGSKYFKYNQLLGWDLYNVTGLDDGDNEIILKLTDGGVGDDDLEVNGEIIDPSGVGVLPPPMDKISIIEEEVTPTSLRSRGGGSSGCSVNEPAGFAEQGWVWIFLILLSLRVRLVQSRLKK